MRPSLIYFALSFLWSDMNHQAPLSRTKCQIRSYSLLLLLLLLLMVLELLSLVILHLPSPLQHERRAGAVKDALHPSCHVLAKIAYPDRRDEGSFPLSVHPFQQASPDQGFFLHSLRSRPQ